MEMLLPPDLVTEPIRPLKRVEYEKLAAEGYFDDERVELLFGMVVEMTPMDPAHPTSINHLRRSLERALGDRAMVRTQDPFAASDISEPAPDIMVVPRADYWREHPSRAYLVVEVARSSLRRDQRIKAKLYGLAAVDEYWIVNHVDAVVEVYRDCQRGHWQSVTSHGRGERIALRQFPDVAVTVDEILPPAA